MSDDPVLLLLDDGDAASILRERLSSRRWWCFLLVDGAGGSFVADLERRHYAGKRQRDFEIMALPFVPGVGPVGIALARKRRMTKRQLGRLLDAAGMSHEAEALAKSGRDVIIFPQSHAAGERAAQWFLQFVRGEPAETK